VQREMLGVLVWVSQGDGVPVTAWWKALAAVVLGSGAFKLPRAAGVCDGHVRVPPAATSASHTPLRARGIPAEPRRLRNRCFPMSLGRGNCV